MMHVLKKWKKKKAIEPRETTHLSPFERVDQTAFADVGEANDTNGDALRRARFVGLEEA
jgi:hypothetical protein